MPTESNIGLREADVRGAVRRAIRLHADGKLDAAVEAYRAVLKRHPRTPACWANLGAALRKLGRRDEGLQVLREGARTCPGFADLDYNLGNALTDAGDDAGAVERYRAILERTPGHLKAAIACGRSLLQLERFEEVIDHCRAALDRHPDNPTLHNALGRALWNLRQVEAAAAAWRRAIAVGPAPAHCHTNLHLALAALGRHAEDERQLREAAAQHPDSPAVLAALGQALLNQGRLDAGLRYCDAALAVDPDCLDARFGRARANFLAGRHGAAWPDYRWRRRHKTWRAPRAIGREWQGQDLAGQSILLYGEQGLGDTIQFARYAPLVAQRGAQVSLYCPPRLAPLLRRLPDVAEVVSVDRPCPRTDWIRSLLDVPEILGPDLDPLPGACPYLPSHTPPRPLLPPTRQFRVGIVWAGNPQNERDRDRSCRLDDFAPLLALPGTEFVSFQVGPRASELRKSGWRGLIREPGKALVPFEATADALAEVDLVITVDTALAHLAGALGRPVWLLLAFAPDWRWLLERIDTPWYPTMRLFRQSAPGDWAGVFRQVRRELAARLARRTTVPEPPAAGARPAAGGRA